MAIIFPDDTLLEASSHRRGSAGEGRGERGREEEEARRLIFLLFVNLRAEREKFFFGIQTVVLLLSPPYPVEFTSKMMERVSPCVFHGGELLPDYRLPPSLSFFHPTEIEIIINHRSPTTALNRPPNFPIVVQQLYLYQVGKMVSRCDCEGKKEMRMKTCVRGSK